MNSHKIKNANIFYFIFIILFNSSISYLLSKCKSGSFSFIKYDSINSKTCNLLSNLPNIYPVAINKATFNKFALSGQCGICYEMVGSFGAVKIRVDDICEDIGDSNPYFKIGTEASQILFGLKYNNDLKIKIYKGINFRMISCDYSDKIKIVTGDNNIDGFSFSCLVLNNNIAVSSIKMKENGSDKYVDLEKNSKNYWNYDKGNYIIYPIELLITSITRETLKVNILNKEPRETYEIDGNFVNPDGLLYEIDTLKEEKDSGNRERCCSFDFSIYTKIYSESKLNQNYEIENSNSTIDSSPSDTLNIKFNQYGKVIIKSLLSIRADQFIMISLSIKSNKICKDCLYLRAYGKTIDKKLSIDEKNTNQDYNFLLTSIGIEDNIFNGIIIYTKDKDIDINIINIELIENTDAPHTEICLRNITNYNPIIPNIITEIPKSIIFNNIVNATITDIKLINNTFIYVECNEFQNIDRDPMILIFNTDSNNFKTKSCSIDSKEEYTQNFTCEIEDLSNIITGEYYIKSPDYIKYQVNSLGKVEIEDGKLNYIIPNAIPKSIIDNSNQKDENITIITKKKFVIINSIDKEINKGDNIIFEVDPININEIISNISEIIFSNGKNQKENNVLFLKKCTNIIKDNKIISISCFVSNNTIRDDYITLIDNQNIEIDKNNTIILRCQTSSGGSFFTNMVQTINANISKYKKWKMTINFDVKYYGTELKSKQIFPYKVYLCGRKINNLRNLDYESFNDNISFSYCSTGPYSDENSEIINGIICNFPDFVPAGEYTKLESEGFDSNPNNIFSLKFSL